MSDGERKWTLGPWVDFYAALDALLDAAEALKKSRGETSTIPPSERADQDRWGDAE